MLRSDSKGDPNLYALSQKDRRPLKRAKSQNLIGGIPGRLARSTKNEYRTQKEPLFPRNFLFRSDGSFAELFWFWPIKHPQNGVFSVCFTFLRKDVKQWQNFKRSRSGTCACRVRVTGPLLQSLACPVTSSATTARATDWMDTHNKYSIVNRRNMSLIKGAYYSDSFFFCLS